MNYVLLKTRLVSFGWSVLGLAVSTLAGMFFSSDFAALVMANFGQGLLGSAILMGVTEFAKHLRNLSVTKNDDELGSATDGGVTRRTVILI